MKFIVILILGLGLTTSLKAKADPEVYPGTDEKHNGTMWEFDADAETIAKRYGCEECEKQNAMGRVTSTAGAGNQATIKRALGDSTTSK